MSHRLLPLLALLLIPASAPADDEPADRKPGTDAAPKVLCVDPAVLVKAKASLRAGDAALRPALKRLVADADEALGARPASVMDKPEAGPSGDKHDYVSFGIYWWPNPDTADGLPYVRKDGRHNREQTRKGDNGRLNRMLNAADTLALAYYFTDDERYAAHAAAVVRAWFVDPATRMNPNFDFAQIVRGRNQGRPEGLIDFTGLEKLVDALGLLEPSAAWTPADRAAVRAWFVDYGEWIRTSKNAAGERRAKNNHGTWFDVHEVALLRYLGRDEEAREICRAFGPRRIAVQVEPDGSQPLELARADGFSYSIYNLRAMLAMARLAGCLDVDLWKFQTPDGRSLRKAVDYVAPYADPAKQWPGKQLKRIDPAVLKPILLQADAGFGRGTYREQLSRFDAASLEADRLNLILPR